MRLVVFGAGAVGSRFAAGLARSGHAVLAIGRPEHVAAIRTEGLTVLGEPGPPVPLGAAESPIPGSRADAVLLTVKSYDVGTAGRQIAAALAGPTPVVALSNGLGIEAELAAGLTAGGWSSPSAWILRGVHTVPARLLGPGRVESTGTGTVVLGRNPALVGWPERLAEALTTAGFPTRVSEEIDREVWSKAIVNATINPVTADHGIPNGRVVDEPWRGQAIALLREALQAAAAEGYVFDPSESERLVFSIARATGKNRSSMLEDLEHGRRTEVDAISGALLAAGHRHGIPMPATERIVARVHAREAGRPPPR